VRLQRGLDGRAPNTRLDARGTAGLVDLHNAIKPTQIEADDAGVPVPTIGWTPPTTEDPQPNGMIATLAPLRPVQDGAYIGLALGNGDEVRCICEVAREGADGFRIGLSVGVQESFIGIFRERAGDRGRCRHPRWSQIDVL
jgi:hypothetical protein